MAAFNKNNEKLPFQFNDMIKLQTNKSNTFHPKWVFKNVSFYFIQLKKACCQHTIIHKITSSITTQLTALRWCV